MESSKPRQRRRRLDEQAWRVLMKRFDGAAMTVREFCAREGLSSSSFKLWRSRLGSAQPGPVSSAKSTRTMDTGKPPFVDLGLLGAAGGSEHTTLELRLDLGGGIRLHLVRR